MLIPTSATLHPTQNKVKVMCSVFIKVFGIVAHIALARCHRLDDGRALCWIDHLQFVPVVIIFVITFCKQVNCSFIIHYLLNRLWCPATRPQVKLYQFFNVITTQSSFWISSDSFQASSEKCLILQDAFASLQFNVLFANLHKQIVTKLSVLKTCRICNCNIIMFLLFSCCWVIQCNWLLMKHQAW